MKLEEKMKGCPLAGSVVLLCILAYNYFPEFPSTVSRSHTSTSLVPWGSIGACGAGSSMPGAGVRPEWIEPLRSEHALNVQLGVSTNLAENMTSLSSAPRIRGNLTKNNTFGITVPFVSVSGEVHARTNQVPSNRTAGGISDIQIDWKYLFFDENPLGVGLQFVLPTGSFDNKRGSDAYKQYLPTSHQQGTGVYTAILSLQYQIFFERFRWNAFVAYAHHFNMKLFSGENEFLNTTLSSYRYKTDNPRFYYRFKPYGENDLGRYIPPSIAIAWDYSYNKSSIVKHTFGNRVHLPLGVEWIPSEKMGYYGPYPNSNHRMWHVNWTYTLEAYVGPFTLMGIFATSLWDSAKEGNPNNENDATPYAVHGSPDWGGFLQSNCFGTGIRYGFGSRR